MDEPFFDNVRVYARYGTNYQVWPYAQRRIFPEKTLMRHPKTNDWVQAGFGCCWFMNRRKETLCAFCFYEIEFVINAGGPSIQGYEGSSRRYYLEGAFSSGIEFDRAHGYMPEKELRTDQSSSS